MLEATYNAFKQYFKNKIVILAFSGGLDSTVLLELALKFAETVTAVIARSNFLHNNEFEQAKYYLDQKQVEYAVVEVNLLTHSKVISNTKNRCYYCKKELFRAMIDRVSTLAYDLFIEGSNLSDLDDYRPGMKAIKELSIRSPFLELEISKDIIRKIADDLGLKSVTKAPTTCLATRVEYGKTITLDLLERIERAEMFVKELLHVEVIRVRYHKGDIARIELLPKNIDKLLSSTIKSQIVEKLRELGFKYISVDLEGYTQGKMNRLIDK